MLCARENIINNFLLANVYYIVMGYIMLNARAFVSSIVICYRFSIGKMTMVARVRFHGSPSTA